LESAEESFSKALNNHAIEKETSIKEQLREGIWKCKALTVLKIND